MTSSITLALQTAQSGLMTSQTALGVVADNISNVNTEGYSRKIVNLQSRTTDGTGAGVQVASLTRRIDEGLLKSLRTELSDFNRYDVAVSYYDRLQEQFGLVSDNETLSHKLGDLAESLESLAVSPNRAIEQTEVVRWAQEVTSELQDVSRTIQELREQADNEISNITRELNDLLTSISGLNNQIVREDAVGNNATSLKDQRDVAISRIAELIDIQYFQRSGGDVVIFTTSGIPLLDAGAIPITHSPAGAVTASNTYAQGAFGPILVGTGSGAIDITESVIGGRLKGLIDLRDQVLTDMQAQFDEIATELKDAMNAVHNRGVPYPGLQSTTGSREFSAVDITNGAGGIRMSVDKDVAFAVFDNFGNEVASTTFSALTGFAGPPYIGAIEDYRTAMDTWLTGNGHGTLNWTASSEFSLNMNSGFYLGISDNVAGTNPGDSLVSFDYTNDGVFDEQISGFSNAFGLNDLFADQTNLTVYDTEVKSLNWEWVVPAGGANLSLSYNNGGTITTNTLGFTAGTIVRLDDLAHLINATVGFATATVIPDGSGERLRINQDSGGSMVLFDDLGVNNPNSIITELGIAVSSSNSARFFHVRDDIAATPGLLSRGSVSFDPNLGATGQYFSSAGGNNIAQEMAEVIISTNAFDTAGGIGVNNSSFLEYGSAIVAKNSSLAGNNQSRWDSAKHLTDALATKADNISGVNLDEEMASLILYQQSYTAAARVISVVKEMFETLAAAT